jgi:hypothetical protein
MTIFFSFSKSREQEGGTHPTWGFDFFPFPPFLPSFLFSAWEVWYQWEEEGGGERAWEGKYSANIVYTHTYVNVKMRAVETVSGMGGKGNEREWCRE